MSQKQDPTPILKKKKKKEDQVIGPVHYNAKYLT